MLVAYGLQINRLGFYWDDWTLLLVSRFNSVQAYWDFFLYDRPFSIWVHMLTMPLLGLRPLAWHVFALLVRWLAVLGWIAALRKVWPEHTALLHWSGILLAVYPGFTQQSIAVTYTQHYITLALFTWSLYAMNTALGSGKRYWLWTVPSVLASLLQMFTMEYFVGLEALRVILIAIILWNQGSRRKEWVRKTVMHWTVYLLPLILFMVYRFLWLPAQLFVEDSNAPVLLTNILSQPARGLLRLLQLVIQDSLHHVIYVWTNLLTPTDINLAAKALWFSWAVGLLAAAFLYWAFNRQNQEASDQGAKVPFYKQAALLSIVGILGGSLPIWISDRSTLVGRWSDRFSLGPMLGATLLLTLLVFWLIQNRRKAMLVLALLTGLAVSSHIRTVNEYAQQWDLQKRYYWQASWRIPDLKPGTVIFGPEMPFSYNAGYSIGSAYNILYNLHPQPGPLPYWFIEAFRMEGTAALPALKPGLELDYKDLRTFEIQTTTDESIVAHFEAWNGCYRVMDAVYREAPTLKLHRPDSRYTRLYSVSNTRQILPDRADNQIILEVIFGPEPEKDWCYYFEKADLARQFSKWEEVLSLYDQARTADLQPIFGPEYIPLIEAYVNTGQAFQAGETTIKASQMTAHMHPYFCHLWEDYQNKLAGEPDISAIVHRLDHVLECDQQMP